MYREKNKAAVLKIFFQFGFIPLAAFLFVVLIPFAAGIGLSLTNWNGNFDEAISFVGAQNYIKAVTDAAFWDSFGKTFY